MHQPGWNMACQFFSNYLQRSRHFNPPHSPGLEVKDAKIREGWTHNGILSWFLVSFSTPIDDWDSQPSDSVIFASVYRLTILLSYNALDPTYTLTRVVGWTAVEMSAGIISACLPTMKPALQLIVRKLGIKGSMPSLFRRRASTGVSNTSPASNTNNPATKYAGTGTNHGRSGRSQGSTGSSGQDSGQMLVDSELRPDHGVAYTVTSLPGKKEEEAGLSMEGAPSHSISVQKVFWQVTD
jgi:hypothetical protein